MVLSFETTGARSPKRNYSDPRSEEHNSFRWGGKYNLKICGKIDFRPTTNMENPPCNAGDINKWSESDQWCLQQAKIRASHLKNLYTLEWLALSVIVKHLHRFVHPDSCIYLSNLPLDVYEDLLELMEERNHITWTPDKEINNSFDVGPNLKALCLILNSRIDELSLQVLHHEPHTLKDWPRILEEALKAVLDKDAPLTKLDLGGESINPEIHKCHQVLVSRRNLQLLTRMIHLQHLYLNANLLTGVNLITLAKGLPLLEYLTCELLYKKSIGIACLVLSVQLSLGQFFKKMKEFYFAVWKHDKHGHLESCDSDRSTIMQTCLLSNPNLSIVGGRISDISRASHLSPQINLQTSLKLKHLVAEKSLPNRIISKLPHVTALKMFLSESEGLNDETIFKGLTNLDTLHIMLKKRYEFVVLIAIIACHGRCLTNLTLEFDDGGETSEVLDFFQPLIEVLHLDLLLTFCPELKSFSAIKVNCIQFIQMACHRRTFSTLTEIKLDCVAFNAAPGLLRKLLTMPSELHKVELFFTEVEEGDMRELAEKVKNKTALQHLESFEMSPNSFCTKNAIKMACQLVKNLCAVGPFSLETVDLDLAEQEEKYPDVDSDECLLACMKLANCTSSVDD
ncbi:uncharacterized protein LOC132199386 [Neocloeon triangulifer]|uniref:uncharacterized protein LOC132199386 n=1 Tax=Neocloeon triangulifer TaxID=2078957 RepID=UPI00286F8B73|nr:uncharacterized protein LOC132199386 [Neocloeon triangulifer]